MLISSRGTNYSTLNPTVLSVKLKQNWQYINHDLKVKGSFKEKWDEALAFMTTGLHYSKKKKFCIDCFIPSTTGNLQDVKNSVCKNGNLINSNNKGYH